VFVLLAGIAGSAALCATLPAQDVPPAIADEPLPSLPDERGDPPLPPAEELPPSANVADSAEIQQGQQGTGQLPPALEEAPADNGRANNADRLPIDDSSFVDEPKDDQQQDDDELLPQETIQERYPDGRVKIERGVAQDERENYVNHGPWRMWDEQGNLIAEGAYRNGKRDGKWQRWYQPNEVELLSTPPFNLFTGPYLSEATFSDGELNGQWTITDQAKLKVCEWNFAAGRRDGESIWYYHTGRKMRVINYLNGQIHGELLEWDINGNPVTRVQYEDGRRHEKTVQTYPDGQKKIEGMVLQARLLMKTPDDWWEAKMATYVTKGKDQKHGPWTAWYSNGQQRFAGEYQLDKPAGSFTWWHPNGQKSLQATYEAGMKQGEWTWWHPNGQKSIQGRYRDDSPAETWIWWHDTGKVAQRVDFSHAGATMVSGEQIVSEPTLLRQSQN
jgi:antitoxin component YwqK of YwqJK toxin-antitoxin module